jgi:hypothetical protein
MPLVDLVICSSIDIGVPAAEVWPHILDPKAWKHGHQPLRVSGRPDAEGEIREARFIRDGKDSCLRTQTVVLEPPVRKVVMVTTDVDPWPGWATWHVNGKAELTRVMFELFCHVLIPDGELTPRQYQEMSQQRFRAELRDLKALLERAPA